MRYSTQTRTTNETSIQLSLDIDGAGDSAIDTGVGFFDHMLQSFSKHAQFDLTVQCHGDIHVDFHHTVEDVGIVLGKAFAECLADKRGIRRYGAAFTPMDESLAEVLVEIRDLDEKDSLIQAAVDISGRPYFVFNAEFALPMVGEFPTELIEEFFRALAVNAQITLHINVPYGRNTHHVAEAIFKSVGRALSQASRIEGDTLPSTKGVI